RLAASPRFREARGPADAAGGHPVDPGSCPAEPDPGLPDPGARGRDRRRDGIPCPPGTAGAAAAAGNGGRLPGGDAAGPVRDALVNGSAPAGLAASFLFTRVPPGPAAPEGAQAMRQLPPRPSPDRRPGTLPDRRRAPAPLPRP